LLLRRPVVAWALYDWANSAFATTVMAGFFPVFFKEFWSLGTEATVSTFRLAMANTVAGIVLALVAPLLGAIADRTAARLRFLFAFTTAGVLATAALYLVHRGAWEVAAMLYIVGSLGFWGAEIFYDSLLVEVAPRRHFDLISGYGYGLGYLGGGLLFAANVWMTLRPQSFGLADAASAVQVSFLSVAIWWALFSIPIFTWVHEHRRVRARRARHAVREGVAELMRTFGEIRQHRAVLWFLIAYWLYIDGVNTIQKMAVDYGLALGFRRDSLITALLVVQFVGFPAALLFGWLGDRIGALTGIAIGVVVYTGVTFYAVHMTTEREFYGMAIAIGLVQGGVQALSRSYFGSLIPKHRSAEFFGFYNMVGKFSAILGPLLIGLTALLTADSRLSILSLASLFLAGGVLLVISARQRRERTSNPHRLGS
jgi:UMF1 family MFS transporter